ncbi:MAG: iron(III) transport system permease protein [Solirubrobacteraceae bacterium]|jgi:iron(III) transport system permease protein|nr:iron(III) transport system permease protein [Solirubrobacteraceae bacterium]
MAEAIARAAAWPRRALARRGGRPPVALVAAALAVALLALLPIAFVVGQTVSIGVDQARALLWRPLVGTLLVHTVALTVTATVACAVIGTAVAWCVERAHLPGRRVWAVVAALPITVPAFVTSYGWVSLTPAVQGFGGATMIVTLAYYPIVYLPMVAALRGMDPALEEAARSLGLGPWRTFFRVTLPQAKPALLGGSLIVAVHLLAEFGAFAMLRFQTFTTAIYDQYQLSFDGAAASMLALVLVVLCVSLLVLEQLMRGRARYVRLGSGAARPLHRHDLGRATPAVVLAFAVLATAALGVPMAALVYWLVHGSSSALPVASLLSAAGASLQLGLGAALVTTVLALPVCILAVRHRSRLSTLLERSTYVAYALPGIVVALAFILVSVHHVRAIYQTTLLLLLAYAVLFLPLALVGVRAALLQASPTHEQTARSLGCGPLAVLRRVTLPLIAPGLGAAATLVFLSTVTELTATLLLAPIGTQTLATEVWSNTKSLAYGAAAPYAALMVAVSAVPTYVLTRRLGALRGASVA